MNKVNITDIRANVLERVGSGGDYNDCENGQFVGRFPNRYSKSKGIRITKNLLLLFINARL